MDYKLIRSLMFTGTIVLATSAAHAALVNDNQIVKGDACVGQDCVNGENFTNDVLRLKENNLRIRFMDSSSVTKNTESWLLEINDSSNGGDAYVNLAVKSIDYDTLVLSDGTATIWDCSAFPFFDTGVLIPAGEPLMNIYNCEPIYVQGQTVYAQFLAEGIPSVILGAGSEPTEDAVSIGSSSLTRMLVNVAQGLADTDVLTKQTLDSRKSNKALLKDLRKAKKKLSRIEKRVKRIEKTVTQLLYIKTNFPTFYSFINQHGFKKIKKQSKKL
ncbi:hypothetical protein [Moritella marina]|uniref:hypothetical protein n=1 Tax=Moritella marina TaxID=90736 RepID=UPI003704549B